MEIFHSEDAAKLLRNKFVVIIGDSIQRGVYKDLIHLLQADYYTPETTLKRKGEHSCQGDELIEGGQLEDMSNKTTYREVRQYQTPYHLVRFYFVTRCYSDYVETILLDLSQEPEPSVVIMNSCLWDITRYGPSGFAMYKKNIPKLFSRVHALLSPECLFLWRGSLPVAQSAFGRSSPYLPRDDPHAAAAEFDVLPAHYYVKDVLQEFGLHLCDFYFSFNVFLHWRRPDGVHWNPLAHRLLTNLILGKLTLFWGQAECDLGGVPFDLGENQGEDDEEEKQRQDVNVRHERLINSTSFEVGNEASCMGSLASEHQHQMGMSYGGCFNMDLTSETFTTNKQIPDHVRDWRSHSCDPLAVGDVSSEEEKMTILNLASKLVAHLYEVRLPVPTPLMHPQAGLAIDNITTLHSVDPDAEIYSSEQVSSNLYEVHEEFLTPHDQPSDLTAGFTNPDDINNSPDLPVQVSSNQYEPHEDSQSPPGHLISLPSDDVDFFGDTTCGTDIPSRLDVHCFGNQELYYDDWNYSTDRDMLIHNEFESTSDQTNVGESVWSSNQITCDMFSSFKQNQWQPYEEQHSGYGPLRPAVRPRRRRRKDGLRREGYNPYC